MFFFGLFLEKITTHKSNIPKQNLEESKSSNTTISLFNTKFKTYIKNILKMKKKIFFCICTLNMSSGFDKLTIFCNKSAFNIQERNQWGW